MRTQADAAPVQLDDTDRAIVRAITADAGITNKALAHRLRLAESTCAYRVRQLRDKGVLRGTQADVNLAALGYPLEAVIAVRLGTHSEAAVNEFFDSIVETPGVLQVFFISGNADFLVHVAVRNPQELRDMVLEHITTHRAVRQAETHLAFESRRGVGVTLTE